MKTKLTSIKRFLISGNIGNPACHIKVRSIFQYVQGLNLQGWTLHSRSDPRYPGIMSIFFSSYNIGLTVKSVKNGLPVLFHFSGTGEADSVQAQSNEWNTSKRFLFL